LATASKPTYAKKTTVAPVSIDCKPFGAKGDQLETSTSNAPAKMTMITMITCNKQQKQPVILYQISHN